MADREGDCGKNRNGGENLAATPHTYSLQQTLDVLRDSRRNLKLGIVNGLQFSKAINMDYV
jgi:hypothetical protein